MASRKSLVEARSMLKPHLLLPIADKGLHIDKSFRKIINLIYSNKRLAFNSKRAKRKKCPAKFLPVHKPI